MRGRGTVRRAEGQIGDEVFLIVQVNHKCPLGTTQIFKEPSVLYVCML